MPSPRTVPELGDDHDPEVRVAQRFFGMMGHEPRVRDPDEVHAEVVELEAERVEYDHRRPDSGRANIAGDLECVLERLAFAQRHAAVLSHIIQLGLSRGQTGALDDGESEEPVRHLSLYADSELLARVEQAATAAGVKIVPWLRHMVRQVTIADFPASWHEEPSGERARDSRVYVERFMLRLDASSQMKLQQLITQFGASKAEIIRQLIAQAKPEDFPNSWQTRAGKR